MPRCSISLLSFLGIGLACLPLAAQQDAAQDTAQRIATFEREFKTFAEHYCNDCHTGDAAEAELAFDLIDYSAVVNDRAQWETIIKMIETHSMPPEDSAQPSAAEREAVLKLLDNTLYYVDCDLPHDPGRVTIRRLNRQEYDNTIRDLIGIDLKLARDFPSDDVGYGFDNIGDVLSMPPLLFEKYMDAAEQVAAAAIQVPDPEKFERQKRVGEQLESAGSAQLHDNNVYVFPSDGTLKAKFTLPRAGDYILRVVAGAQQAGEELAKMELTLADHKREVEVDARADELRPYEWYLNVEAGEHEATARFINDYYNPEAENPEQRDRNLFVQSFELIGPVDLPEDQLSEAHRRIVTQRPDNPRDRRQLRRAAREVLEPFVSRAYRRPATPEDIRPLVELVGVATENGDSFERGIQLAVTAALVSPHFLFRVEQDPQPENAGEPRTLSDFELATRLSYFLWSSMPDEELFKLARDGRLNHPDTLVQQVRRMLHDEKAFALAENFGGQWLNLRNLAEASPNPELFPEYSTELRESMLRETLEMVAYVLRENRPITDFLTADYSFVDQRLAQFYGLQPVEGERFQRVSLEGTPRRGVLTQASILTITSNPGRTSPVKRGKWIMENILGTPPPDPPPNVPQLEETQQAQPGLTLRQQLELHRADPVCASCHRQMDALGFAFENFDPIGRWRDKDGEHAIDPSGVLPDGTEISGSASLVEVLTREKEKFARTLAEKMLTYALGRGLEYYDRCAVDKIMEQLEANEYRMGALVEAIVLSEPFRMRRVAPTTDSD